MLERFPVHVVSLWMGHDAKVSLKHYAQTTDEHFDRAASGAESGSPNAQNTAQRGGAAIRPEVTEDGVNGDGLASCATACDSLRHNEHTFSGEGGIRTSLDSSTNLATSEQGSAESGALCLADPRLGSLIDAWPTLPEPIRVGILAVIRAAGA